MAGKQSWGLAQGDELAPGRVVVRALGGGLVSEVYLVWDERLFALVVAKILRPDRIDDPHAIENLSNEANILSKLAHPGVIRMFDAALEGPRPHIVLEFLEGPTLKRLLKRYGPLGAAQLLPLAVELASVLHYLSRTGVVHLDVKPANVVMSAPPRLVDFSVARTVEDAGLIERHVGTDAYMSPEQCEPAIGKIGTAADVWGLGATVYEAIAGRLPFDDAQQAGTRFPQISADPAPLDRGVPEVLGAAVMACLAKQPSDRPTPSEFARRLQPLEEELQRTPVLRRRPPRIK